MNKTYPYEVPASIYYNTWSEPSHRQFVRKTASSFGWDWGPSFIPVGIPGQVYLVKNEKGALVNPIVT